MPTKSGNPSKPKKTTSKKQSPAAPTATPKDIIVVQSPMPGVWQLLKESATIIGRNRWLFLKIGGIYGLLSLLFQGKGIFSVNNVDSVSSGSVADTLTTLSGGSDTSSDGTGGVLQFMLVLITSLALIWSLRQIHAGHPIRAKDAFYKSTAPLIPFLLTLLVITLQLLPLFISASVFQVLIGTGIIRAGVELAVTITFCVLLALPSIYFTIASFFAPYIVTLPDMKPMAALRSARELVYRRRTKVYVRLLALPVALIVTVLLFMIPVIVFIPAAIEVVYLLLSSASLIFLHTYMYTLYWGLLDE